MTKLTTIALLLTATTTSAFAPSQQPLQRISTELNLFGSKNKDSSSPQQGGGGMMDQLAMMKKMQEMMSRKAEMDKELANEKIVGTTADGKVSVTVQYVPPQLPMKPMFYFDVTGVDIDEGYLGEVSAEELSEAVTMAAKDAESKGLENMGNKYKSLEADLAAAMGGMGGLMGAAPQE